MARAQMQKELAKALKETEGALEKIAKEGNIDVGSSMRQRSVSVLVPCAIFGHASFYDFSLFPVLGSWRWPEA